MSMTRVMQRKWRSTVINSLRKKRLLTDSCKVTTILHCGTVKTACGKTLHSAIPAFTFESMHQF